MITNEQLNKFEEDCVQRGGFDRENFQFFVEVIKDGGTSFITALPPGSAWIEMGHDIFVIQDMAEEDLIRCIPKCPTLYLKIKNPSEKIIELYKNI